MKTARVVTFTFIFFTLFLLSVQAQDASTLIAQGDSAYDAFNNKAALDYYSGALQMDTTSYEAAWKLSRAYADVGENFTDKDKRHEYFLNAEKYARKAVALNPDGSKGHLYLAIAVGRVALDSSKKEQVRLSKEVKSEVDKALELNPNDGIAWHVLGRWNRKMATLGWIQRKFANIFLGGVPKDASLDSSVLDFKRAIKLDPGHINNYLELGITYDEMKEKDKAREMFQKVLELPKTSADDDRYKAEAGEYLKKLK
jgi:tetratricopeptide (TPR) repeat protein